MPTIKRKVEMNLPQLIEWGFKQEGLPPLFYGSKEGSLVQFTPGGWVNTTAIEPTDTFTVEVEEEITENSKLYLVERYISSYEGFKLKYRTHPNRSIKSILEYNQSHLKTTHIYAEVNNELALIWTKEKGLVD